MSSFERYDEHHAELAALEAAEAELVDGPDAALQVLGPPTDPIRMRSALGILLRADRHQAAADLIGEQRPDEKWMHLAAVAFAFLGDFARARLVVEAADDSSSLSVMRLTRLGFADGVFEAWRSRKPNDSLIGITDWTEADVDLARTVIEILDPLILSVRANRRIGGDYELNAITSAVCCACITRDYELLSQYTVWLEKYVPIPLVIAELCLRGLIKETPTTLPNRLRTEHSGNFHAALLAAMVERDLFDKFDVAFEALVKLSSTATSPEEKDAVCIALFETGGRCGPQQIQEAIAVVNRLRPENERLIRLLHVVQSLVSNDVAAAQQQLDAIRDEADGLWWQSYAQLCERKGDEEGAQHAWEKASELIPHPDVVRRSVKASIDRRRYQSAIRGLTKLLEQDPDNEKSLKTLAWAQTQVGDHSQAIVQLTRLVDLSPSNHDYRIWLAQTLAYTARITEAIEVIRPVCDGQDPPLTAMLVLSGLLAAENKPDEAFRVLSAIAPDYWDDLRFLFSYVQRGYAARQDRSANEAFARLLELRREGKVPAELLQEGTIEQFIEFHKSYQSRSETLRQALLAGRMTWLFAEELLGNSPAWAWTLHTQEMKWLTEEPLARAGFSLYSTNGFFLAKSGDRKTLQEIVAPAAGTVVVVDLSALLTLHKLDLLHDAAKYFGRLILPATYGPLKVRDADRFAQHQPSRKHQAEKIRELVDQHRIRALSQRPDGIRELDEYTDSQERHVYRLQDLLPLLRNTQKASTADFVEFSKVAHKSPSTDESHPALQLGDELLVDLTTLRTLSDLAVFSKVQDALSLCILTTDYDALISELRAHEATIAAKTLHDTLWSTVADMVHRGRIEWRPLPTLAAEADDENDARDPSYCLDALQLAQHLKLPLLCDDRVLQVAICHEVSAVPGEAFGSDCLLQGMLTNGEIEASTAARGFRQMMNWRYRFLVPSGEILFAWAKENAENLPGPPLLDAAFYLHDSLRDPGLHCGAEQSDPPMPIATKYAIAWLHSVVSLLTKVWSDASFSVDSCIALTQWVGRELVPSVPRGLWYQAAGHNLARVERVSVFSIAMVQFTGISNRNRANLALRVLAQSLGISDELYPLVAADAIRTSKGQADGAEVDPDAEDAFCRVMMQNALFHLKDGRLDALAFSRFKLLGLLTEMPRPSMPELLIGKLREAAGAQDGGPGRLIFVPDDGRISVIEVEGLLLHPRLELRQAALEYLYSAEKGPEPWLTPHTLENLKRLSDGITATDEKSWLGAGADAVAAVRDDILATLVSLKQSLTGKYQYGIEEYVGDLLRPRFEVLDKFRPHVWNPAEQQDEIKTLIHDLAKQESLERALSSYLQRCGYVPLARATSASQLAEEWLASHPDEKPDWSMVWDWAQRQRTPLAKYHAITIALHIPSFRPVGGWDQFWQEAVKILDLAVSPDPTEEPKWSLVCELASHFMRHIEAIHPAQHGDAAASYSCWLASQLVRLFALSGSSADWWMKSVVNPQSQFSYFRWTAARSPVVPSPMRSAALNLSSAWTASLLTNLASTANSLQAPPIPESVQQSIAAVTHGYLATSYLAQMWEPEKRCFAFQENEALGELFSVDGFVPADSREQLTILIAFRRHLAVPERVEEYLNQLTELPLHMQHLLLLALKDLVYSTRDYDQVFGRWLEQTKAVAKVLETLSDPVIEMLVDILVEFQQHQVGSWPVRVPHLVAYVIEGIEDPSRRNLLASRVLQLSVNGGVESAILRVAGSGRWPEWATVLETWRGNLLEMSRHSEPWVSARIRSVSATVSRLIGPGQQKIAIEDEQLGDELVSSTV